uniref:hypothetical protein n=1 Tax=Dematophora necatrix TaxID=2751867 RepID=UPI0030E18AC6
MRTPKINALYKLIDFLNIKFDLSIEKKKKDKSNINSNSWLAGFIDADGHFSVRTTTISKYPKMECKFVLPYFCELEYIEESIDFMEKIVDFLEIQTNRFKLQKMKKGVKFIINTQSIISNEILINYLNKYPLFSSNFLNFNDFVSAFEIFKKSKLNKKLKCNLENFDPSTLSISSDNLSNFNLIKRGMHHNRTIFNWDHLNNLYNLNCSSHYDGGNILNPSSKNRISSIPGRVCGARSYSTNLKINVDNLDNLKFNNNNIFVSSIIYNNAEEHKLMILADNRNKVGIYMWTHLESSKKYIGSSVNLSRRFSYYFSSNIVKYKKSKIHNALLTYGYSAFSLTIIEYIDLDNLPKDTKEIKKFIIEREQYYIDNILPEYNILKIAGSLLGFKHSEATLMKFKLVKESKNNPMYGKVHLQETKLKISESKKGKPRTEETKLKISLTSSRKLYLYTNDTTSSEKKVLFKLFDNYSAAAEYLNCSTRSISRYVDKDKLLKKKWFLTTKDINSG